MSVRVLLVALALIGVTLGIMSATPTQAADDSEETVVLDVSPQADALDEDHGAKMQSLTVLAVAGAPAAKHLVAVTDPNWEAHLVDRGALLDLLRQPWRQVEDGYRSVEHLIDAVQEAGVVLGAHGQQR